MDPNKTNDRHPRRHRKACAALETYLAELLRPEPDYVVHVYASGDRGDGFRIHEIDVSCSTGGCSWMRSTIDLHTSAVILAAEDFVRTFDVKAYRPKGWQSDLDEHGDATEKLSYMVEQLKTPA